MNELDILTTINKKLYDNHLLGDDCAEIKIPQNAKSLFITHDTLVEDVHFTTKTITPYELAQKAIAVNISDLCAGMAEPKFITISLSLPQNISKNFIEEFYDGVNDFCGKYKCTVAGGDLTRADKIVISICAIGQQEKQINISRGNANIGDIVLICGNSGSSAIGLLELTTNPQTKSPFTEAHIAPIPQTKAVKELTKQNPQKIACMDTSDGLADALYKIATASGTNINVNANHIPTQEKFYEKCNELNINPIETILFGAEDFSLVIVVDKSIASNLPENIFTKIGKVSEKVSKPNVKILFDNEEIIIDEQIIKEKTFNHFKNTTGENNEI